MHLLGPLGEIELRSRDDHGSAARALDLDEFGATLLLRRARVEESVHALRRLLAELDGPREADDAQVLERVAALIARGRIVVVPAEVRRPAAPPAKPEAAASLLDDFRDEIAAKLDWIEVMILDQDDQPAANVGFELVLPDGAIRHGRTDSRGFARYDRIPAGQCRFRIEGVDAASWGPA